jgi:hypothetical protein
LSHALPRETSKGGGRREFSFVDKKKYLYSLLGSRMALVIVRVAQKLATEWLARHERDGLNEWKLSSFVRGQYALGVFDRVEGNVLVLRLRFQKRGGSLMTATLWVRERKHNGIVELVIYKGHVERVEGED